MTGQHDQRDEAQRDGSRPGGSQRDFVHRGFGGAAHPGDIAPGVLLVRSREEVLALASGWTGARLIADHYAFLVWTGRIGDTVLTACSTGTGSASAAIAIEELAILGARTIIGLGATRDVHEPAGAGPGGHGAVVVAEGAWRADAASAGYVRTGFPAVPDTAVVTAIALAARAHGATPVPAIVADIEASLDARIGDPPRRPAPAAALEAAIGDAGVVPVHGSPAVLFVAGTVHGLRTAFAAAGASPGAQHRLRAVAEAALVRLAAETTGQEGPGAP